MLHARRDYDRIQDPQLGIPDNEPVFLIRGQDRIGADTVRFWANLNDATYGNADLSQLARKHAILMDQWPVKKRADLPEGQPSINVTITAGQAKRLLPLLKPEDQELRSAMERLCGANAST